jgi:hypothetical protein
LPVGKLTFVYLTYLKLTQVSIIPYNLLQILPNGNTPVRARNLLMLRFWGYLTYLPLFLTAEAGGYTMAWFEKNDP